MKYCKHLHEPNNTIFCNFLSYLRGVYTSIIYIYIYTLVHNFDVRYISLFGHISRPVGHLGLNKSLLSVTVRVFRCSVYFAVRYISLLVICRTLLTVSEDILVAISESGGNDGIWWQ